MLRRELIKLELTEASIYISWYEIKRSGFLWLKEKKLFRSWRTSRGCYVVPNDWVLGQIMGRQTEDQRDLEICKCLDDGKTIIWTARRYGVSTEYVEKLQSELRRLAH